MVEKRRNKGREQTPKAQTSKRNWRNQHLTGRGTALPLGQKVIRKER